MKITGATLSCGVVLPLQRIRFETTKGYCNMVRLVLLSLTLVSVQGFEFMKSWKMPTYDPYEAAVKERFGDKSKNVFVIAR